MERPTAGIVLFCIILSIINVLSINHWMLKENTIIQKVDSPFYMQEPHNLNAFLDQVEYNDFVESTYVELLRQRALISERIQFSLQLGMDLVDQAACALDYRMDKKVTYLKLSRKYLRRLSLPNHADIANKRVTGDPVCSKFAQVGERGGYLDSSELKFQNIHLENEVELGVADFGFSTEVLRRLSTEGLTFQPLMWKYHTLSSYYWRLKGNGKLALECARLGSMLAPKGFKDIPLLSMGTILLVSGRFHEAKNVLISAVEHSPNVPENHFLLGAALALSHEFNLSLYHLDITERLDPSILPKTLSVKNFISCLDNLKAMTAKMYSYIDYIKTEVMELKRLKYLISQSNEKLTQQQVPLGARFYDNKASNDDILRRGQYCSTRTPVGAEEPVLFCDFFSDIQMRLESKDVDIEELERNIQLSSEVVVKQVSTKFQKHFNLDMKKGTKISNDFKKKKF